MRRPPGADIESGNRMARKGMGELAEQIRMSKATIARSEKLQARLGRFLADLEGKNPSGLIRAIGRARVVDNVHGATLEAFVLRHIPQGQHKIHAVVCCGVPIPL
jgi:hypothetical protein